MAEQLQNPIYVEQQKEIQRRRLQGLGELFLAINETGSQTSDTTQSHRRQDIDEYGAQLLARLTMPPVEAGETPLPMSEFRMAEHQNVVAYYSAVAQAKQRILEEEAHKAAQETEGEEKTASDAPDTQTSRASEDLFASAPPAAVLIADVGQEVANNDTLFATSP